ncbi:hypothetical protein VKT23_016161 [Stygiomarasmius scandens]|uniref:Uncharacterized protein n=1 Tax=Marasmiellus scandens TaxID=2682957 RepID=A0ABR1IZB4_9AGAR
MYSPGSDESKGLQPTWNDPLLSERWTPLDTPGATWLRAELLNYLTPSFLVATNLEDQDEFFEFATQEWLDRFPSDILPGSPSYLVFNHNGCLKLVEKSIEAKFARADRRGFTKQKQHLQEMCEVNILYGTVRPLDCGWREGLACALSSFDRKFPVDSISLPQFPPSFNPHFALYDYIQSSPRYKCFSYQSERQLQGGVLLWSWYQRDYDDE